jgi:hypothetical protein
MFAKIIQKKIKNLMTPEFKTTMLQSLSLKINEYKASYHLEAGQDIIGIVRMSGDNLIFTSNVITLEDGKIKTIRCLHQYKGEELADLVINNIDKVDLSSIL